MRDRDIDDRLKRAADAPHDIDPALLDRISTSLGSGFHSVGTLPPGWVLAARLVAICVAVALAGGLMLGLHGFHKMSAPVIALIFPVLGLLIVLSAAACVAEAVPGSRRPMSPLWLAVSGCALLAAVFILVFSDYRTENFVSQGVKCLAAGLAYALPTAGFTWLLLRRGFSVNPAASGLARGMLAGLAGVAMLELHCPNFEAPHILVWHLGVLVVSAAVGTLAAVYRAR